MTMHCKSGAVKEYSAKLEREKHNEEIIAWLIALYNTHKNAALHEEPNLPENSCAPK